MKKNLYLLSHSFLVLTVVLTVNSNLFAGLYVSNETLDKMEEIHEEDVKIFCEGKKGCHGPLRAFYRMVRDELPKESDSKEIADKKLKWIEWKLRSVGVDHSATHLGNYTPEEVAKIRKNRDCFENNKILETPWEEITSVTEAEQREAKKLSHLVSESLGFYTSNQAFRDRVLPYTIGNKAKYAIVYPGGYYHSNFRALFGYNSSMIHVATNVAAAIYAEQKFFKAVSCATPMGLGCDGNNHWYSEWKWREERSKKMEGGKKNSGDSRSKEKYGDVESAKNKLMLEGIIKLKDCLSNSDTKGWGRCKEIYDFYNCLIRLSSDEEKEDIQKAIEVLLSSDLGRQWSGRRCSESHELELRCIEDSMVKEAEMYAFELPACQKGRRGKLGEVDDCFRAQKFLGKFFEV